MIKTICDLCNTNDADVSFAISHKANDSVATLDSKGKQNRYYIPHRKYTTIDLCLNCVKEIKICMYEDPE